MLENRIKLIERQITKHFYDLRPSLIQSEIERLQKVPNLFMGLKNIEIPENVFGLQRELLIKKVANARYEDIDTDTQIQLLSKDGFDQISDQIGIGQKIQSYEILDHPRLNFARKAYFELYHEVLQEKLENENK